MKFDEASIQFNNFWPEEETAIINTEDDWWRKR